MPRRRRRPWPPIPRFLPPRRGRGRPRAPSRPPDRTTARSRGRCPSPRRGSGRLRPRSQFFPQDAWRAPCLPRDSAVRFRLPPARLDLRPCPGFHSREPALAKPRRAREDFMTAIALRSDDGRRTTEDSGQIGRAGIIRRWVRVVCHLAVAALIGLCFAAPAAMAAKKDNALRVADDQVLDNVDPYFNNVRIGVIVSHHVWDTLIYRGPKSNEYKGQLATSWKWIDQKTLELELRKGVKFHNGASFDADDVVYTLNFVSKPENKATTQSNVDWIDHAEKLEPYRVRIVTRRPFPAAIEYLAGPIVIHPHEYYEQVGPKGMNEKPVGSGPYRVVEHAMGKYIRLVRNPDYFKDSPKPQPQIENVELRFIPDRQTQVAEMLSGGLDLIKNVPLDQAQQLRGAPSLQVVSAEIMRYAFLQMDSTERTLAPQLRDPRVRKAIMHAIDRAAMVKSIVGETSRVLNVPCFPSHYGCSDRDQLEAMIGYLRAVGIRANLRFLQYAAHRDAVRASKAPIAVWTW